MKDLNFIRGRWRKKQLTYLGIDLGFMALFAFISMFILSIIFSWSSEEDMKVENYIQSQITKFNSQVAEYSAVKIQRDKLLDISTDLANIKASQYYILLDIEKISRVIMLTMYLVLVR